MIRSTGARSVMSRSKSKSSDCSTTWVAMRICPRRASAPADLPKRSTTRASIVSRSASAKRAWNGSSGHCGWRSRSVRHAWRASATLLRIQQDEARWWRDSSLLYFQTFSRMPIPANVERPRRSLEDFQSLTFPSAPGH